LALLTEIIEGLLGESCGVAFVAEDILDWVEVVIRREALNNCE